jgi:hypothetical protein
MIALAADAGWLWRAPFGSSTLACKCSLRRCARSLWKHNPRISRRSSRDRVGTVGASCRPLLHSSWPPRRAGRLVPRARRAVDEQCVCVCCQLSLCVYEGPARAGVRAGGGAAAAGVASPRSRVEGAGTRPRGVFDRVHSTWLMGASEASRTPGTTHMCDIEGR